MGTPCKRITPHRASQMIFGFGSASKSISLSFHLMMTKAFVHPVSRGIFSVLPLGQRVIDKLVKLIERELDKIGAFKLSLPALGPKELWMKVGRWDTIGSEILRLEDRSGKQFCLQPTAEEMITEIVAQLGTRRHDGFPLLVYQTGSKFRDEMNPRFGLLRSREFIMNDLYSFDLSNGDALRTYDEVAEVYHRILHDILNLEVFVVRADNGAIGGAVSHEYHLPSQSGEDRILFCKKCLEGVNWELARRGEKPCANCTADCTTEIPSVEVAHTFQLGSHFSRPLNALHSSEPLIMNCYGLGIGRIVASAIDVLSPNENSLRLPDAIVPFKLAVIPPSRATRAYEATAFAESLIEQLVHVPQLADEVFVDDRVDISIGKRIIFAAGLGIPNIVVIGGQTARSLEHQPLVEYFRVEANKSEPIEMGTFLHRDLFRLVETL